MTERKGAITFKGGPVTLLGNEVKVGDKLPAFKVTGTDMADITNDHFAGKVLVLSIVPSVDTPVCATQTRKFNEQAAKLNDGIRILTVSLDLPFAAKRFCAAEGISAVVMGSDFKHQQFGTTFGVKVKELGLLCRAVFVTDRQGKVVHAEYVKEATQEPNYEAALAAAKKVV